MKLIYINKGIGNRVGDTIYLNSKLKQFPKLHNAILLHEKKHTGRFTLQDLSLDINNKELIGLKGEYYQFIINNPNTWLNFLPIMKIKNIWTYDLNLICIWLFIILLGVLWFLI